MHRCGRLITIDSVAHRSNRNKQKIILNAGLKRARSAGLILIVEGHGNREASNGLDDYDAVFSAGQLEGIGVACG